MPTARNARGIDVVAYSRDGKRYLGIQVKSLSKINPVPLGKSLDNLMGDFWVIINQVLSKPLAFILTPEEVRQGAHCGEKYDKISTGFKGKIMMLMIFARLGTESVVVIE